MSVIANDASALLLDQVNQALAAKTPLRIQGSGSKAHLGRATSGEVLDTRQHRGIVSYDPTELVLTARAGTPLAEIEAAETVTQFYVGEPRGLLRVSCPPGDCADAISNMLPGFLADYPNVRVELLVSMRRVDLISEQVDVAVRARSKLDTEQDLIVKQLAMLHAVLVAGAVLSFARALGEFGATVTFAGSLQTLSMGLALRGVHADEPHGLPLRPVQGSTLGDVGGRRHGESSPVDGAQLCGPSSVSSCCAAAWSASFSIRSTQ